MPRCPSPWPRSKAPRAGGSTSPTPSSPNWTSNSGLLASKDKGATWAVQGSPIKAFQGPYFGKAARHLVVVNDEGFQETTDGGRTWKVAAPLPPGIKADRMTLCAWDEKAGIFYVSRMTKPTLKYVR